MTWNLKALFQERLAREQGTIRKDPGGKIQVALAYPNTYHVGMSNLGFLSLYRWLNRYPDIVVERVFLPDSGEARLYDQSSAPLMSLESQRPVSQFDVLVFSIAFENDYQNFLTILDLAHIPSQPLKRDPGHPLVLAGGVATFLNPEPIASFLDLVLIGEAEALLDDLADFLREFVTGRENRQDVLEQFSHRPGFYVPSLYRVTYDEKGFIQEFSPVSGAPPKVVRARAEASWGEAPQSGIVTPDTEFSGMALLEIGRACGRGCRFCAAGYVYRPLRPIQPSKALAAVEKLLEKTPRLGLISPGIADIPYIDEMLQFIHEWGGTASLSSVRADSLSEEMLDTLHKMGQKSLAIAPEAGSERLRRVINKDLSEDDILEATLKMCRAGLKTIRLYFMIGLPTEEKADVEAIVELTKKIRHHLTKNRPPRSAIPFITLSVASFVPKPHTPFQWEPMERVDTLKRKLSLIRKGIGGIKGARLHFEPPKWSYIQALLSTGDRRVAAILQEAASSGGRWRDALTRTGVNPDFFVHRRREPDEILPWDFIDHGFEKSFLREEYQRALEGKPTPPCDPGHCKRCGIC